MACSQIRVTFTETVTGVDVDDLLVNNQRAISLSGSGAGPYTFDTAANGLGALHAEAATGIEATSKGYSYDALGRPAAMSQVRAGRLRPLAVSTKKRTPILPNGPTVAEATGLKGYEVDSWYAVFAPAKTPDEAVQRMQKEIAAVATRSDVSAKLLEQGAVGVSSTPEELGKIVHREIEEWRAVVKRANIEGE